MEEYPQPLLEVTDIRWERVNLTLALQMDMPLKLEGAVPLEVTIFDGAREFPVEWKYLSGQEFEIHINVTRFVERKAVPNGSWRIRVARGGTELAVATFSVFDVDVLEDASRSFVYAGNRTAYTVTFGLSEDEVSPELIIRTYQFFRGNGKGPRNPFKRIPLKVRKRYRSTKTDLLRAYYRLHRTLRPRQRPEILFASSQRETLGGNLLSVYNRMIERGLDEKYELTLSFRVPATSTKRKTLRAVRLLARAETVLLDDYFPMLDTFPVANESRVVQLWHAGSGFKNVGYSRFGKYGSPKLNNAHRKYHYAICGSKHLVPVYAEAFGIEEDAVIPTGLPRLDEYLDEARVARFKKEFYHDFPELAKKKIILFAPTFRGRGMADAYYRYSWLDLSKLYTHLGTDTVFLFKMHPFVREQPPIPSEFNDRIKNFTDFPNINDLLLVTNVLITDYSSVIYEYSLLNRPMLFFAPDKDEYSAVRGFHRPFDEVAPGRVCSHFGEVLEALDREEFNESKRAAFLSENFDYFDSKSTDRVIDWLVIGDPPASTPSSMVSEA